VLPGLMPGTWKVRALFEAGGEVRLQDLVIPHDAPSSITHPFVFPSGSVRGRVKENTAVRWWASLHDARTLETVSECEGNTAGGAFELRGIPRGEYRLVVSASGFADYRSARFSVARGEAVDVGEVALAACGVMDLEVVDRAGSPVPLVQFFFNGEALPAYCPEALAPGKYRLSQAPLGPAVLTLKVDGVASQELYIDLAPGKRGDYRVVME
jgi:hypothetical protein